MSNNMFDSDSFQEVLKLLSDGQFHSGEELGLLLGVSRAAVWKTLKKFELIGVDVVSVKGKGYCINGGLDLLDESKIIARHHEYLNINIFQQLDSTNSYLLRQKKPEHQVCLAENQTAGRGRRGRVWVSPFAQSLYLSVGWGFEGGVAALEGLSLAIGVGIVRSLRQQGVVGLSLKWPNDILYNNKKLGGILIEVSGDPAGYCLAVIGVGLNVSMTDNHTSPIGQPWINLADILIEQSLPALSRNQLASYLLEELASILSGYDSLGFAAYRDEWVFAAAYINQTVTIQTGSVVQKGVLHGVDKTGALLLHIDGNEQIFHGGEVSLRGEHVA